MPRKTKKQKIVADYRKRLKQLATPISSKVSTPKKTRVVSVSPVTVKQVNHDEYLSVDKKLVVRDLRKTVFLSLVAIGIEIVLYFLTSAQS